MFFLPAHSSDSTILMLMETFSHRFDDLWLRAELFFASPLLYRPLNCLNLMVKFPDSMINKHSRKLVNGIEQELTNERTNDREVQ